MRLSFDHLVCFSKQPEAAIPLLHQAGIHAVPGGRHKNWGTYNTLAYFGLSYIEFLGIEDLAIAKEHEDNRLVVQIVEQLAREGREGPATIAIRTDNIEKLANKLKGEGLTIYGPLPGNRVRTDGVEIRWSLLFVENPSDELRLPFFIQWEKSDEERSVQLLDQSSLNPTFETVGFVMQNLEQAVESWSKLFNLKTGEEYIDSNLNARCQTLELSGTKLVFCSPIGTGPAEKVLKNRGEGLFLVNLTKTKQNKFFEMMNGYWRLQ
ncbi:VOC family protein [Neobacillus sp. K501]